MPYFATGPAANDRLEVRQVQYIGVAADAPAAGTGEAVIDVTIIATSHQGGPNALVGRQVDISTPTAPVLVTPTDAEALAARRPEWLGRTGGVYLRMREDAKKWWPDDYGTLGQRDRAATVLEWELPNWTRAIAAALAHAIQGRAWTGMTATQIDAAVSHIETLQATGIVRTWYDVGVARPGTGYANPLFGTPERMMDPYANPLTYSGGYSDALQVQSDILVPRDPDYAWLPLTGYLEPALDFNPEAPS